MRVLTYQEINSLIPASIPLVLTSGTVDKVHAQIPFPNLWSAPLTLSLDTLTLDFTIRPTSAPAFYKDKSPEYPFRPSLSSRQPTSPSVDLAASVTSAAGEFLHGELDAYEEAELDRSIRQSLILSRSDPFESENVPGAFPTSTVGPGGEETGEPLPATLESTTVLAGLVERILARLEVEVANVRLRIRHQSEGHHIELRIGQIRYADESATPTETAAPASTTRVVRISDIRVYMIPSSSVRQHSSNFSSRSSSTSTFSGSTDDGNMAMSLAVADLRQSMVSDIGSDASVYHSAISESSTTEPDHDSGAQRSRSSTPKAGPQGSEGTLILSFGTEDVVISIKTTRPPSIDLSGNSQRPGPTTGARPDPRRSRSSFSGGNLPSVEIDVAVGAITVLLVPSQMASLLTISQAVSGPAHPENASPDVGKAAQPKLEAKCRIKGIIVSAIYDMNADSDLASAMASYWTRPSSVYLPVGHLKLKLDSLEAAYAAKGHAPQQSPARPLVRRSSTTSTIRFGPRPPVATVRILDISIFEYIATDTTPASDSDDKIPGGAYPVLLFDAGLTKQYDHAPQGVYVPGHNAFPEFDAVDWRNSGLQKKSGGGEKAWKVRPKGRGVLKGVPGDIDASPVLVMKQDLSPGARKLPHPCLELTSAAVITEAQPIHIFLDLSMVERLLPVLRHITPSAESSRTDRDSTPQQSPRHRLPNHFVIDDLDAQASSISTLQPTSGSQDLLVFKCPMVRLDIRCPAPPNRRGSWGDGAHLRSCIVTLDIHGLHAVAKRPMEMSGQRRGGQIKLEPKASVEWEKMYLFFCRVPGESYSTSPRAQTDWRQIKRQRLFSQ
jgi:autophagy-related protein 2